MAESLSRLAALLRRWVAGEELSSEEKQSLVTVLPNPAKIAAKETKERYARPLAHYAREFGTSPRTLKRWIDTGRKANDFPPLDDPVSMSSWWSRRMKQRVPAKLLEFSKPESESKTALKGPGPNKDWSNAQKGIEGMGSGYAAALDRARANEMLAASLLAEAQKEEPPDEGKIVMRQRTWDKAFDSLRKAEKDAEPVLLASSDLVRWSDKERELLEGLSSIHQGLRSLPVRVATKLGITGEDFKEMTELWHVELDKCFEAMARADFGPSFELDAA